MLLPLRTAPITIGWKRTIVELTRADHQKHVNLREESAFLDVHLQSDTTILQLVNVVQRVVFGLFKFSVENR